MKKRIIVFAPHPDDEILGCGGTIAKRASQGYEVIVCVATNSKDYKKRRNEEINSCKLLGVKEIVFLNLKDLYLDREKHEVITKKILDVIKKYEPEEIYTPHVGDLHTDHRALTEAVMVAIRPKYEFTPKYAYTYETLSETGWKYQDPQNSFNPNVYENITKTIDLKIKALNEHKSQLYEYPSCRSLEAIEALAIYRGTQAEMKYAEAFTLIRRYNKDE